MPNTELELKPVDFLTIGTVGPRGRRVFHLQGAKGDELITLTLEKVQASALAEALVELLEDLDKRFPSDEAPPPPGMNLDLREPIEPEFRVAQIGLGYDEENDLLVLVTQELLATEEEEADLGLVRPSVVRFWAPRLLMRELAARAANMVEQGRPDPQRNGRVLYYWT